MSYEPKVWEAAMGRLKAEYDEAFPFGRSKVKIEASDGSVREFDCAVADTDETRARGMVGRTFDGFEAMLFAYEEPVEHAFHMNGVPIQLYIAWAAEDGTIVDHVSMFTSDPWHYKPSVPYKWAIELPVVQDADYSWLSGAKLVIEGESH